MNIDRKIRKNQKFGALSASFKDELVNSQSRKKTIRFMKQKVITEDKKVVEVRGCKKRKIREVDQTQCVGFLPSSHVELRNSGCEVLKCTKEASIGLEPNELVEVRFLWNFSHYTNNHLIGVISSIIEGFFSSMPLYL